MTEMKTLTIDDKTYEVVDETARISADSKASKPNMTTVTLSSSGWDATALTQSATVSGILADETKQIITVAPYRTSMVAASESGIYCSAQAANSLTFTCLTIPSEAVIMVIAWQDATSA